MGVDTKSCEALRHVTILKDRLVDFGQGVTHEITRVISRLHDIGGVGHGRNVSLPLIMKIEFKTAERVRVRYT
jgi:hypothetical protein